MHHNTIDQALNINLVNNNPVVPHTGGGDIAVPNTGFFNTVVDGLGPVGCSLVIAAIVALIASVAVFLLRKEIFRHHSKIPMFLSAGLLLTSISLFVPATISAASAFKDSGESADMDIVVGDDSEVGVATKTVQIGLEQPYEDGYVVYAYTDQDNKLYNEDKTAYFAPSTSAASIEDMPVNTYAMQTSNQGYAGLSTNESHPTKVVVNPDYTDMGSVVQLTYAAKADNTMPNGKYASEGESIHFDVEPDVYNVTYHDEESGEDYTFTQKHDPVFTIPQVTPQKRGYMFKGWTLDPNGTTPQYQPGDTLVADYINVYIYPIWQAKTYSVVFDANGGKGGPATMAQAGNNEFTLPKGQPTRQGYLFLGWATKRDAVEPEYQPNDTFWVRETKEEKPAYSATLYAVWGLYTEDYTLFYDANGGFNAPRPTTDPSDAVLTVTSGQPTRTGYEFIGWALEKDSGKVEYRAGDKVKVNPTTHNSTLYAVWQPKKYMANFVATPETGTCAEIAHFPDREELEINVTQYYDSNFNMPDVTPVCQAFIFDGWVLNNKRIDASDIYQYDKDVTIRATYKPLLKEDVEADFDKAIKTYKEE